MAQKRQHSPPPPLPPSHSAPSSKLRPGTTDSADAKSDSRNQDKSEIEQSPPIFQSASIHDRSSTFTAIFSPAKEYMTKPLLLQRHEPFRDADHRMVASRRKSNQKGLSFSAFASASSALVSRSSFSHQSYTTWSDDDGEKYAGKKLEKVLNDLDVEGTVVVARWWGGVMLGPVRFEHIANAAKEAILKFKQQHRQQQEDSGVDDVGQNGRGGKRVKLDDASSTIGPGRVPTDLPVMDEAKEKDRLIRILNERDESVDVLRSLLNEKSVQLRSLECQLNGIADPDANGEDVHTVSAATATTTTQGLGEQHEKLSGNGGSSDASTVSIPVLSQPPSSSLPASSTKPDYSSMQLQRLKQLEKARDASLSWILKQIDATEIKIKDAERAVKRSEPNHSVLG